MFESFVLLAIALNSVLLALTDYSVVRLDISKTNELYGLPDTRSSSSSRNFIQESLDPVFTIVFL